MGAVVAALVVTAFVVEIGVYLILSSQDPDDVSW